MNLFTIIIIGIIIAWIIASVWYIYKNRDNGCSGNCSSCTNKCSSKGCKK